MSSLFDKVQQQTNVKKEDIVALAKRIQGVDLKNEQNLRKIIHDVAKLAGREVSKDKENKIVDAVKGGQVPKDIKSML